MGKLVKLLLVAVGVFAIAGGAVWYFFLRSDAPEEVSLSGAVDSLSSPTAAAGSATPGVSPSAAAPSTAEGLDGAWTVASGQQSFAGYRVNEELAQVGFTTAVGRTSGIEGTFEIKDNELTSANIEVDMTGLKSDKGFRDNALRDQAIETNRFPTATFVLGQSVALPDALAAGQEATVTLSGDLTLHGVTRPVEIPVEVVLQGDLLVGVGSIDIVFADYEIARPRANAVVSIEDHGVMELQLILKRGA